MSRRMQGEIEVDPRRGVLYLHNYVNGCTTLRLSGLKKELKKFTSHTQLDIMIAEKEIPKTAGIRAAIVMRSNIGVEDGATLVFKKRKKKG